VSQRDKIELPFAAIPGSSAACQWLEERFAVVAEGAEYEFEAAWMFEALALAHRARLEADCAAKRILCPPRYVRASLHAPLPLRRANRELGLLTLERWPGVRLAADDDERRQYQELHHKAGLACELQVRADALADALRRAGGVRESVLRPLLPAISPAGLGGHGDARTERHALALLEAACVAIGLDLEPPLELPRVAKLPRRIGELRLEHPLMKLRWRRRHGLCWTAPGLRECSFVASLEVQGDGGGRGAFAPTHPPRPRWFEVAHMQPVLHDPKTGALQLRRTLELPVNAQQPGGRHQELDWTLTLWLDQQSQDQAVIDLDVQLSPLVAGHRYRLALPLPFWPRPGVYPWPTHHSEPELWQHDGPHSAMAIQGTCSMACREAVLIATGHGIREAEVTTRKNEQLLHLTLARVPEEEAPPAALQRRIRLIWRPMQP
jgi:hypothetical protein